MGRRQVNGQLSVVPSVGRNIMGKAPAVRSGRALPMGRCASPPLGLTMGLNSQLWGQTGGCHVPVVSSEHTLTLL